MQTREVSARRVCSKGSRMASQAIVMEAAAAAAAAARARAMMRNVVNERQVLFLLFC
jgi:hypothetical protein